jgi:hypothetical protein
MKGHERKTSFLIMNISIFAAHTTTVVSGINNEDTTYDYVFGGPRSAVSHSTLKLTSPPVRLRPDGRFCKLDQCQLILGSNQGVN